jgi:serine/threonine-protein kinase
MRISSPVHQVSLHVLGAVDLQGAVAGDELLAQPKRLGVFVYLLLAKPYGFQRRDTLLGLFWPEFGEAQARAALRKALHGIRRALGDDVVVTRGDDEVSVARDKVWCDAVAFDEAMREERYAQVLELFSGELLAGFNPDASEFERWVADERTRVHQDAANAAWLLAERYEKGSDITSATKWARKAAELIGSDERRIRKIMQLFDRAGDRAGAIAAYESFAKTLRKDLDIEPSAETQALANQIGGRT